MNDGVGVCTVCAKVCHKDHDISYAKYGSFFCDCGAKEDDSCIVSLAFYVNLLLKAILSNEVILCRPHRQYTCISGQVL